MDVFLNVKQLKEEIEFLKNAHKRKTQLGALKNFPYGYKLQEDDSSNSLPQSYSDNVKLLMAWVNAVCGFYNMKVNSFVFISANTSFAVIRILILYRAEFFKLSNM